MGWTGCHLPSTALWKMAPLWTSLLLTTGKSLQLMLTLVTGSKGNPYSQIFQRFRLEGRKLQWCEATHSSLLLMDEMKGSALAEERHWGCTMNAAFNTLERFSDALLGTCWKKLHQAAHSLLKAAIMLYQTCRPWASCCVCVLGQSLWHLCVSWEHSCCCCDTAIPQRRLSSLQNENKCSSCGRCTTIF